MKTDPNDARPPFRRAADDLRRRIRQGEFADGRLPSIKQLAAAYEMSPQTVQSALKVLRDEQLIVAQHGRGLFVRDPARPVAGTDAERLAAAEAELHTLRERVAAVEAGHAELRALVTDLQGKLEELGRGR